MLRECRSTRNVSSLIITPMSPQTEKSEPAITCSIPKSTSWGTSTGKVLMKSGTERPTSFSGFPFSVSWSKILVASGAFSIALRIKVDASRTPDEGHTSAFAMGRIFAGEFKLSGFGRRFVGALYWTLHGARTNAAGAGANGLGRAVDHSLHALEIRKPFGLRLDVRVGDQVTGRRALFTEFTNTCHDNNPFR